MNAEQLERIGRLYLDSRLTPEARYLAVYLEAYTDADGVVSMPSLAVITEETELSPQQVADALQALQAHGSLAGATDERPDAYPLVATS